MSILFLFVAIAADAQEAGDSMQKALPPDVRLVIDVSGSMKRNDPNNLRQPAIELLVQLLPENSRAGIWTFGKWVNMLVPHKPVTQEWREAASKKSSEINSVGLFTNIGEALEKSAYDIAAVKDKYRTSIILLTDGMVDIDKSPQANKQEWRRIADEILPKLKDSGITVHTIALSENADKNLLNKLSISTGGMAEVAHSADDLMRIFLKTFDASVPSEQVPLTDNQFVIDSSVEEFTALIFRKNPAEQTELIGPDKTHYSAQSTDTDAKWYRADNYDLITISQPLEGEWGVKAEMDPDSRVTVVSNLNLRVAPLPVNVFKGQQEPLLLFLQEDGKTIVRPDFLSLMTIDASMEAGNDEFDLREFWSKPLSDREPPENGQYTALLPAFEKDGIYQLSVTVDGKTFVRQFNHQFTVRQPFGAEVKQIFNEGRLEYVLFANSYHQNVDIPNTQVVATVFSPNGRKKITPLQATDLDTWKATLMPDVEGEYRAQIKVKGLTKDGSPLELTLDDIPFNYSLEGGFVKDKEPFFEEPAPTEQPTPTPTPTPSLAPDITTPEPVPEAPQGPVPTWLLYVILVVGNLLLFGLGFFAFRKIMGSSQDVLDPVDESELEPEPEAPFAEEKLEPEPEFEEEPPMEDLTSGIDEQDVDDLDPGQQKEKTSVESSDDGLDDIDGMAVTKEDSEDDDMVSDILKAQGLDLAEDELDEAISNLIDDLDAESGDDQNNDDSVDEDSEEKK